MSNYYLRYKHIVMDWDNYMYMFSLKENLTNENNRKNDKTLIVCLKRGGGRVLQLHGS